MLALSMSMSKPLGTKISFALLLFFVGFLLAIVVGQGVIGIGALMLLTDIYPVVFGALLGASVSLFRRNIIPRAQGETSLLRIIINDLELDKFTAIRIISLVYTLLQGALFGAATGFLVQVIAYVFADFQSGASFWADYRLLIPLMLSGACVLSIVPVRILAECYVLVFRFSRDISSLAKSSLSLIHI